MRASNAVKNKQLACCLTLGVDFGPMKKDRGNLLTGRWKEALPNADRDVALSCRVPEALRVRTRRFALERRTSLQEVVITALDEYLKRNPDA